MHFKIFKRTTRIFRNCHYIIHILYPEKFAFDDAIQLLYPFAFFNLHFLRSKLLERLLKAYISGACWALSGAASPLQDIVTSV